MVYKAFLTGTNSFDKEKVSTLSKISVQFGFAQCPQGGARRIKYLM